MNWNDFTANPKVIRGYYDTVPSLAHVRLHSISLHRDGPLAEIVVDLRKFPERPSAKWPVGANTCQITIHAIGLTQTTITKWGTGVDGEITIQPTADALELSFAGEGSFRFVCSHVHIAKVVGYRDAGG